MVELPFLFEDLFYNYGNSINIDVKLEQQYADVLYECLLLGHLENITDILEKNKGDSIYLPI